jgi:hypothetical protein
MTADVEAQRARDRAVTAIARLLAGRLLPGMDAAHIAAQVVDGMHADGWRHVPRPQPITAQGRKDPETAHRGAARVRAALPNRTEETEMNHDDTQADYECTICGGTGWINGRRCTGTAHSTRAQ